MANFNPELIPAKFGSKVPENQGDKPKGGIFDRLRAKLEKEKTEDELLQPHLGELLAIYRHHCTIFIAGDYVGEGYGNYHTRSSDIKDYDRVGEILSKL